MDISDHKIIKKTSQWIPIKKWRHNARKSIYGIIQKEKFKILDKYLELTTYTNDRNTIKDIVKKNLRLIEIEIASFCNRKCWFCPNSIVDRHSTSIECPESTYLRILENLHEISYSGTLNFHRFNEPLANKALILKRVKQARDMLPHANLGIFTNGDYLDREYLDSRRDVGINFMIMSYYFDKNKDFDVEHIIKPAINKMANKLHLQYHERENTSAQYAVTFIYDGIDIMYRAWNPKIVASDRGGSIQDQIIMRTKKRDFGCFYPWRDMYIDYNGLVMPCCNMRSDIAEHKDFILGDVKSSDLFALFMNENFIKMRQYLTPNTVKHGPCAYCHYDIKWGIDS